MTAPPDRELIGAIGYFNTEAEALAAVRELTRKQEGKQMTVETWNKDIHFDLAERRRHMKPEEIEAEAKLERERMASGEMTAAEATDRAGIW
jgi:hypothetical protein